MGSLGRNVKPGTVEGSQSCLLSGKYRTLGLGLTRDALVRVFFVLITTVLWNGILRDRLHLDPRCVGQHSQVLKQSLSIANGREGGWALVRDKPQPGMFNQGVPGDVLT